MNILITGGSGFIGQRLASELLTRGCLNVDNNHQVEINDIIVADIAAPQFLQTQGEELSGVQIKIGDISDKLYINSLFTQPIDLVFHLASIVSGQGEDDFDLALKVNLFAGQLLFNVIRAQRTNTRIVFASSIAVFGGDTMPQVVSDFTKQTPGTTYGMTKAMLELLVNDYSRKQFFDGRSARLPTVIIRPGNPNKAASGFFSGLFREPLNGEPCVIPVDLSSAHPVSGYRAVVNNLIKLAEIDSGELGSDRAVCLPAINTNVRELMDALKNSAGTRATGKHILKPDHRIAQIVDGWPKQVDAARAITLGLNVEPDIEKIVGYYIDDYLFEN